MKFNLILASRSPRRQMLLQGLDLDFQVIAKNFKEDYPKNMKAEEVPEYLSRKKAEAYANYLEKEKNIILTADTIVVLDDEIIHKPKNESEAIQMLQKLSGQEHTVITGVCLTSAKKQKSFSSKSKVHFRNISNEDIEYYVNKYQPYDKAGAYGIQEWIGYIAINHIEGSFYNVMGLPTQQLYEELLAFIED